MAAPQIIRELIDRFDRNIEAYESGKYNETQVRREFIDPFFEALGWDVNNTAGNAETYKDVIHEDAVKVSGVTKAPDYAFRIGGQRKFFVEAKKPSVNLKDEPAAAFQIRRYAWSAKLPLSIITDFEEFAVYDCRIKPDQKDKADKARIIYYTYRQYADKWDEIAAVFSKNAILKGSFDKYAESSKAKRGTSEVDSAILSEIESWRDALARNIALRNMLSVRELNDAVQRTIDRIIFLRIAEDRGIEDYGSLRSLCNGSNTYGRLQELFYKADDRYNSGLFHFRHEKDEAEPPDNLTTKLVIDDKPLKDILKRLYYPDSPYEFSVLPADILGQVYEQFLGKVIRLTSDHRAVVEDKPEVKKAGGVFYTPTYIVDYIVKNTVGKLLEGKNPKTAGKLRILDPACGSGSFLLGAYQNLLDWHLKWYTENNPEKYAKAKKPILYQGQGGAWHLTTAERKRILLNNIYGVDIDIQAVEVTKLSLLLKVLEDETGETLNYQFKLFHERALPNLGGNIKCGNSLIGPDFYDGEQMNLLDTEEAQRVNVFDWQAEFPEILKAGGFDAVIGNPPYIRIQALKEWVPKEVEFYKEAYQSAQKGNYDIYVVFVEKGLQLLNKNGRLGFILPHKFFNAQYGEPLRKVIANGHHLAEIIHFGDKQVFANATTYTCLLFLERQARKDFSFEKVENLQVWQDGLKMQKTLNARGMISANRVNASEWNFASGTDGELLEKLAVQPVKLNDVANLFVGLQTDADDIFILEEIEKDNNGRVLCKSKETGEQHWFEDCHLKPFLKGSLNIKRYKLSNINKRLIFPYSNNNNKSEIIGENEYKHNYPLTWQYLLLNKSRLEKRNKSNMGSKWYGYVYKKNHTRFDSIKLLVPSIATGSCFTIDDEGKYFFVGSGGGGGGGYGITLKEKVDVSYSYLLGLLNSSTLNYYLKKTSTSFRGGYIALNRQYIEQLPIRAIDLKYPNDKANHDRMVQLVEQMLALHKQLTDTKNGHDKTLIQRQIDVTDKQIDKLVYELYELTPAEIAIVEGN
jgi:type I restriction-modification system DNA methylase subunit